MVGYRRNFLPGGSFFFTVTLRNRRCNYLTRYIHHLRDAFRTVQKEHPFRIEAIVILPEHLHTIWTLPENDTDYPARWRGIKRRFTRHLKKEDITLKANSRGEYNLWQSRYWEHTIKDEHDLQRHIDYIHYNPVKHGFARRVIDWPHSSFHRFVNAGILSPTWSTEAGRYHSGQYGE